MSLNQYFGLKILLRNLVVDFICNIYHHYVLYNLHSILQDESTFFPVYEI